MASKSSIFTQHRKQRSLALSGNNLFTGHGKTPAHPPVLRRFLINVTSCWFDNKEAVHEAVELQSCSLHPSFEAVQVALCNCISSELSWHFTSPQSTWELLYLPCHAAQTPRRALSNVLSTGQAMSKGKCYKITVSVILHESIRTTAFLCVCWSSWESRWLNSFILHLFDFR